MIASAAAVLLAASVAGGAPAASAFVLSRPLLAPAGAFRLRLGPGGGDVARLLCGRASRAPGGSLPPRGQRAPANFPARMRARVLRDHPPACRSDS